MVNKFMHFLFCKSARHFWIQKTEVVKLLVCCYKCCFCLQWQILRAVYWWLLLLSSLHFFVSVFCASSGVTALVLLRMCWNRNSHCMENLLAWFQGQSFLAEGKISLENRKPEMVPRKKLKSFVAFFSPPRTCRAVQNSLPGSRAG